MIKSSLGALFALAVFLAAGHGALTLLSRGAARDEVGAWPERAALIWLLGVGCVSLTLFGFGFLLSGAALIACVTAVAVALYAAGRIPRPSTATAPPVPRNPLTIAEWTCVAILVLEGFIVLWSVARFPLGWDGLTIWDMKAEIAFANDGRLPAEYFRDVTRSWSHVYYPLNWSYAETWLYLCLGRVDQTLVRSFGALFYAAAVGLFAGAVPRLGGTRFAGLVAANCLFFLPMLTAMPFGVFSGYADFPLAVIYLAAICRLPFWREEAHRVDDRLLAALAMLTVWTKTEGKVMLGVLLISSAWVVLRRGEWRRMMVIAFPAILLLVVHGAFLRHVEALPDKNYFPPSPGNVFGHLDRLPTILRAMGAQFINWQTWSLLWPGALLAIASLALTRRRAVAVQIATVLVLPLPGYALAYILSTWPDYERHIQTSLSRLLLGLAPAALLAIGLALPKFTRRSVGA
jgi:hypothetical protein